MDHVVADVEVAGADLQPRKFAFAIPLKPRDACADWAQAQANLRRTIRSIRNAHGGDDAIIAVACHEPPDLGAEAGVEILTAPFPAPVAQSTGKYDKARKRRFAGAWLRRELGGEDVYVMFLDADDLIHRDLLRHAFAHGQGSYLIDQGYVFDSASGVLWRRGTDFHQICGSSFVCAFGPEDLPTSWEDDTAPFAQFGVGPDQRDHHEYDQVAAELGRPAADVPFPGVLYLVNHPESRWAQRTGDWRRPRVVDDLIWPRAAAAVLSEEFGAPDLAEQKASAGRTAVSLTKRFAERAAAGVARRAPRLRGGDSTRGLSHVRQVISTDAIGSDLDSGGLRAKVRSGLGWKLMTFLFGQGTQSAVSILLAHLLVPRDFGVAGMAIAFTSLAAVFADLGLGTALIQKKTLTEEDRSTVFMINVGGGAALTLIGVALSPAVAAFFSNSQVMPLFAVLSCSFFISSLGQTQAALLTREMSYRSLELRTIAATLVGAAASVSLAVAGFGPWAIIANALCTSAASTLFLWTVSPWRPRLNAFSRSSFRLLGSFGFKMLLIRVLLFVNLNGDNLLIGRYLGSAALGVYAVAYNLMLLPASRITAPARDVLYSAFVRLQNEPRRMGEAWLRINSINASVLVPAFFGLIVLAPDVVPGVLGQKWHAAVPVLEFLSVAGIAQSLQAFNGQVYQALGLPGYFLRFMYFSTAVTFSAFVIGLHWGVSGVAASFAAARTIVLIANTIHMERLIKLGLWRIFRSYVAVVVRAGAMAAAVFLGRRALLDLGVGLGPRLALLVAGGAVLYLALMALTARGVVRDLRSGLTRRVATTT
jgi:O-antigen/teichoic acid export membrane protein